jgi:hypothetical protein
MRQRFHIRQPIVARKSSGVQSISIVAFIGSATPCKGI